MIQFELPEEKSSIIKVMGVGGGGSNAVNHMYRLGIKGVDFYVCNTDVQALNESPVPNKIHLGKIKTKGLGAGSIPEVGRDSALESIDEIRKVLSENTEMVFITAGMGGGTGTGAAPVIASVARELGILTVGIVTMPFTFEGKRRRMYAEKGLEEMKKSVDTLLVINNDKLRELYGSLKMREAFAHADNVLTNAAKSIAELISTHLHINLDLNDVRTVMKDSGLALMGTAVASGENRALKAVQMALASPLLNDNDIVGARHVLLNIMAGSDDIEMDEFDEITQYVNEASGNSAEVIFGYGTDTSLGDTVSVTIIATGFQSNKGTERNQQAEEVHTLSQTEISATSQQITDEEPFVNAQKESASGLNMELKTKEEQILTFNEFVPSSQIQDVPQDSVKVLSLDDDDKTSQSEKSFSVSTTSDAPTGNTSTMDSIKSQKENLELVKERIRQLKNIAKAYKNPEMLNKLEKEPAYLRQNIQSEDLNYNQEEEIHSKYTIEEEDGKPKIKPNNSFLHGQPS
ncbi:MAG: cell division protein FtsZ [Bacteroidia bacterium]|nr:cell division protein FtsZ [Bacteroidia bacterium]